MASRWSALILAFFALLAVFQSPASAQGGRQAALSVCIAPLSAAAAPREAFAGRGFDCDKAQYRHGPGDYWALSAPIPAGAGKGHLHVRSSSLWQRGTTLYALYADGKVAVTRVDSRALSNHVQLGAIVDFALPYRRAAVTRLLWRIDGSANARGVVLNVRLVDAQQSDRANIGMAALYSGFAGLAIGLICYNLAIWGALRHSFQLAYCAMVAALLVYAVSSSGALAWAVPIDNNDRIRLNYVTIGLAAGAALLFARTFFERRVFEGWLGRATEVAIGTLWASGIVFAIVSHYDMPLADRLCSGAFLMGIAVIGPMLWRAWVRGSRYLVLFAFAWAMPVLFAGVRILSGLHVLPVNFWIDNSTVLSMSLEAMLSSLAIAYRIQMLSRERDAALAGEMLARQQADADPLTGLLNRRAFLARAIGRAGPQTLHVIDLDHFKSVNETLGHDGGDEVLRIFARTLRGTVPADALIVRMGGEEFAILAAADCPVDSDRILARLRAARMPFDLSVTASIGSCTGPVASEADWRRLYRHADNALFEAKAAGRDRARRALTLATAA